MPNRIDTFKSIFRRANKPIFRFSPPKVEKILLMSDLSGHHAQQFEERVRQFVETGEPGGPIAWESVHGEKPDTREGLIKNVEAYAPDLVVTHRNLYDDLTDPWKYPIARFGRRRNRGEIWR